MSRDTRPDQHTRHIDVPVDPIEQKRDALKADRLELTAQDLVRQGRSLSADLLLGHAMALRGLDPITGSAVLRTAHAWAHCERSIGDESDWAQELVSKAATAMNFRQITIADFLRGVAAGLAGLTVAPQDATATFRMGLKAVLECQRGRPQYTELAIAAPSEPKPIGYDDDPLEHEPTRAHSAPTTIEDQRTAAHVEANPTPPPLLDLPPRRTTPREADAPVVRRGGRVGEDDLTSARLIPKTEQLKAPK